MLDLHSEDRRKEKFRCEMFTITTITITITTTTITTREARRLLLGSGNNCVALGRE